MNIRSLTRSPLTILLILCWIMAIISAFILPTLFKIYAGEDWRPFHLILIYIGLFGPVICCTIACTGFYSVKKKSKSKF